MTGFGKDGRGVILYNASSANTALQGNAAGTVGKFGGYAPEEDFRILRMDFFVSARLVEANEEPMLIGLADNELTAAEIEEAIEASPVDRNDHLAMERSHRPVWLLGLLRREGASTTLYLEGSWDKRWTFSDTEGWTFFGYNMGANAYDANVVVDVVAKYYGVWVK